MVWLVLAGGAVIGGILQTVCGFGAGVFMMMYLPYFFGMLGGPSVNSCILCVLTISLAWKFRRHFDLRITAVPIVGYLGANTLAIRSVKHLDLDMLAMVFGIFLLALAGYNFFVAGKFHIRANWKSGLICSAISGAFGGLFGIGGPLMSLYYLDATDTKEGYAANMQGLFALSCINGMANRIACGIYTAELILPSLVGIVFVCVGSRLGLKLLDKLDAARLKKIVYLCVAASGAVTVLGHLPF